MVASYFKGFRALRSRLAQRVTSWVFLGLIVIEGVILVPSYFNRQRELLTQLEEESKTALKTIALTEQPRPVNSAVQPKLSDAEVLSKVKQLPMIQPQVLGGTIYWSKGKIIGRFGQATPLLQIQDLQGSPIKRRFYWHQNRYEIIWSVDGMYILVLRYDTEFLRQPLMRYVLRILVLILVISVVVTVTTMIVLDRIVLRSILYLRDDLLTAGEAIGQENAQLDFYSLRLCGADELGEVAIAFKEMYRRVDQEINDRKQAEAVIRKSQQQLQRKAEREELLNMLAGQIRNSLDLDTILQTTVSEICEQLQIHSCAFLWFHADAERPYWEVAKECRCDDKDGYPGQSTMLHLEERLNFCSQMGIFQIEDVETLEEPNLKAYLQSVGYTAMLGLPILTSSGKWGMLTCGHTRGQRTWTEDEVDLLKAVSDQLAIAISQAELYEQSRSAQAMAEKLLLNILPEPIATKLKQSPEPIADRFPEVTILFADLVNFTELSSHISPLKLVNLLNEIFSTFDRLVEKHGLEKIKTIGDAYMVVGGLPTFRPDHAEAIADMALDMQTAMSEFQRDRSDPFQVRIGINTGPVVAGVIGIKKFIYDLWGDAVNVASRMESHGLPDQIQVSDRTYHYLKEHYILEERGQISIKGKGEMVTYWLKGKNRI